MKDRPNVMRQTYLNSRHFGIALTEELNPTSMICHDRVCPKYKEDPRGGGILKSSSFSLSVLIFHNSK